MSRLGKIARRTFLFGTAAIAGGVAFGWYWVRKPHENPLLADLEAGEASFNPWVKITPEKITLITPHADVGQGAVGVQSLLIAEELDLEPGQFETDFGDPSPAYYNTAFADEGAPFRTTDFSFMAETTRDVIGGIVKVIGVQGTGGSTTVPDSYDKLRMAGAIARETLKAAASARSGVAVDELKTQSGHVVLPDGSKIAYTELAAEAAGIDPVQPEGLRDPSQWRLIGKPQQRPDIIAKSTGTQTYGIDMKVDGMVHAAVKLNPNKGAPLKGFDAAAAQNMRGVREIVEVTNGVAVIADNTWRAIKAAEAVACEWEATARYPAEQEDHWKALEASFTPEFLDSEWRHDGDVPVALENSTTVIEAEYRAPYVAHQPLEPINAVALVTDEKIEIWTSHQMPRFLQQVAAGVTGDHDNDQVIFHNLYGGGSFGHRLEFENVRYAVEIANKMRGTPVKLTFSREEDFRQNFTRQIAMAKNRGVIENGKIVAADFQIAMPSPIRSQFGRIGMPAAGPDNQIPAGVWNMTYGIENFRTLAYAAEGLAPVSSWRAVGASSNGFFGESFIDELIHAAGLDPLQARIDMCTVDYHRKVLEAVGEMSDWGAPLAANKGRGVAFVESFGVPCAEVVEVTNTDSGIRIDKVWVAADVGRIVDPVNFENQVQGGVIWSLGHAMNSEITYSNGAAEQDNYHMAEGMRLYQAPEIMVRGLENGPKIRGVGEPPVPPAPAALANAIFAATGQRIREMPFNRHIDFV